MTRSVEYREMVQELEEDYLEDHERLLIGSLRQCELLEFMKNREDALDRIEEELRNKVQPRRVIEDTDNAEDEEDADYSWEDVYKQMRCEI